MLSFFYVLLYIAAGSNASPCKPSGSPSSSVGLPPAPSGGTDTGSISATGPSPDSGSGTISATGPGSGSGSGGSKNAKHLADGQNNVLSLPNSTVNGGLSLPAHSSGGRSCPKGFMNTVFNTNAPKNGGWPTTTWSSLVGGGVSDWIGFSISTLDKKDTYGNCPTSPELNSHQIHLVMDPRDTDTAIQMVKGDNPPKYLGLFNEPDFSFGGFTPLTDPVTAAKSLAPMFNMPHPQTTYISPGLMNANSDWLTTFKANCNGCFDQIPIMSLHVYNPTVDGVMSQITQLHNTWPDKKIWITELSPAAPECQMDATAMAAYMNELIQQILALGYVEKVFWNSGEWGPAINKAPEKCNPALTDASGNATPILKSLQNACGGGGTATS